MGAEEYKIKPVIKVRKSPPATRSKNPRKKYGKRWYSEIPHSFVKRK